MSLGRDLPQQLDQSIVEQLEAEFAGRVDSGVVVQALRVAARDLNGSIRAEALPQMTFTLARYRLDRDSMALAVSGDLEGTLRRIVETAMDLVGARYGAVGLRGPDGALSHFIYHGVDEATQDFSGPLPAGHAMLGMIADDGGLGQSAGFSLHPGGSGLPAHHRPMRTFLAVPIVARDRTVGRFYLTDKDCGAEFTGADENVVRSLAAAVGLAIASARPFQHRRRRQHRPGGTQGPPEPSATEPTSTPQGTVCVDGARGSVYADLMPDLAPR